jgi:hypothetical protein
MFWRHAEVDAGRNSPGLIRTRWERQGAYGLEDACQPYLSVVETDRMIAGPLELAAATLKTSLNDH